MVINHLLIGMILQVGAPCHVTPFIMIGFGAEYPESSFFAEKPQSPHLSETLVGCGG